MYVLVVFMIELLQKICLNVCSCYSLKEVLSDCFCGFSGLFSISVQVFCLQGSLGLAHCHMYLRQFTARNTLKRQMDIIMKMR